MSKIVLITGGCGFHGYHLVKEFYFSKDFDEIRIFDLKPLDDEKFSDINNGSCKITSIVGDIRNHTQISNALLGVTSVIHNAGAVDVSLFANEKHLMDINVNGTRVLIENCIKEGVKHFVYTSTVDVAVPFDNVTNHIIDEAFKLPENLLFKAYGASKLEAEELVLRANGTNGLKAICLRPTVLYGEFDVLFIPSMLRAAKRFCGVLSPMGSKDTEMQQTYAGNAAWAHVCSLRALQENVARVEGRAYYITDDTPISNAFQFAKPFLKLHNYKLSMFYMPYWLIAIFFSMVQMLVVAIHLPIEKLAGPSTASHFNLDPALSSVKYVTRSLQFDSSTARKQLKYLPKYDFETSLKRSKAYYVGLSL